MADNQKLLAIYLNDHLAGATVGREVARRALRANRGNAYGRFLSGFLGEIEGDIACLRSVMEEVGVGEDRLKLAVAWVAEKAGRAKLNGQLTGYSPLSRVMELEGLTLGVEGKLGLWRSLRQLAGAGRGLGSVELEGLIARAEAQRAGLEEQRLRAVEQALAAR